MSPTPARLGPITSWQKLRFLLVIVLCSLKSSTDHEPDGISLRESPDTLKKLWVLHVRSCSSISCAPSQSPQRPKRLQMCFCNSM